MSSMPQALTTDNFSVNVVNTDNVVNTHTINTNIDMNANSVSSPVSKKPKRPNIVDKISQQWQGLPPRDKWALIILGLFMLTIGGGYGGYVLHESAKKQQGLYQAAIEDYFWLRAQAGNINPNQTTDQSANINQQLTQILAAAGVMNPQVVTVGDALQLSFIHDNQAMISHIVSNIANSGYTFEQLQMVQNPQNQAIQVQASIKR